MLDTQVEPPHKTDAAPASTFQLGWATYPPPRRYERELWSSSQFTARRAAVQFTDQWTCEMSNESILMMIVIGGVAGWLAGLVMRGSGYGIVGDIVVGLLGAFVGNWLLRAMSLSINLGSPALNRIVVSLIGALLLMFIVGLLRPRKRERVGGVWRRL
jgi:uncharacterized membrane protein YeaQ/YmgE (transglycosylase-associated protein family)